MKLLIVALLSLVGTSTAANAYIEAGSMIIVMQIIVAAGAGFILMFRRVRTFFASIGLKLMGKANPRDARSDRET